MDLLTFILAMIIIGMAYILDGNVRLTASGVKGYTHLIWIFYVIGIFLLLDSTGVFGYILKTNLLS